MCGHIGMMGPKMIGADREKMMEEGLYVCALRGTDSVGLGIVPDAPNAVGEPAPYVTKRCGAPPVYIHLPPVCGAKVVIGHVRSATIGNRSDAKLAHPFQFDQIIGAHNGTLRGDWRGALEEDRKAPYGSDSEAIFFNFAWRGAEETIQSIHGAWCLVWWDDAEQTLNFLRNDERPLWFAMGSSGVLYWASEYWMIQAMTRAGEKGRDKFVKQADGKMFFQLPINTHRKYAINEEGNVVQLDDSPLLGATPPPPPPVAERPDGGSVGTVFAVWENGGWVEVPEGTPQACKLSKWYADEHPEKMTRLEVPASEIVTGGKNLHGKQMWRTIAGVRYVSSPTGLECSFDEFMEYRTDGSCLCCGFNPPDPHEIGYIADDLSWFACRDCTSEWCDEEWTAAADSATALMEMEVPFDLDADADLADGAPRMVTLGHPPADNLNDPIGNLIARIEDSIPGPLKAQPKKKGKTPKKKKGRQLTAAELSRASGVNAPLNAPPHQRLSAPPKRPLGERWDWWNDGPRT